MEFAVKAEVEVIANHVKGENHSRHVATNFLLKVSSNLKQDEYLDKEGLPTEKGSEVLTSTLVEGLIGNLHMAHQKGWRDSAEHLRYIIEKLETGFIAQGSFQKGEM